MRRAALCAGLLGGVLLQGCKVSAPGRMETALMTGAKHQVFVGNRKQLNPISASARSVADGKVAFSHYCVVCHGLDGQNTGVPFADHMNPPVPSLKSAQVQSYTDGQLKWVIDNGITPSGMPSARGILSDEEQWAIVVYLRHLPSAGSLGEPAMYGN
jgi:mono/diheme cytochrome c family protein